MRRKRVNRVGAVERQRERDDLPLAAVGPSEQQRGGAGDGVARAGAVQRRGPHGIELDSAVGEVVGRAGVRGIRIGGTHQHRQATAAERQQVAPAADHKGHGVGGGSGGQGLHTAPPRRTGGGWPGPEPRVGAPAHLHNRCARIGGFNDEVHEGASNEARTACARDGQHTHSPSRVGI